MGFVSAACRALPGLAVLCFALTAVSPAAAQSSANAAAAQALFEQGKTLIVQGKPAEACPKLEESQRLDPGGGTLLYLARCYELTGQLASAWTRYVEAADMSKATGNVPREREARKREKALRPRLSQLVLVVPKELESAEGLVVTRDGEAVGRPQWGLPVPADAGEHTISASATGLQAWQGVAVVKGEGTTTTFTVPVLAPAAAMEAPAAPPAPPAGPPPEADAPRSGGLGTQKIVALVAGGVGVIGLGVGTVFGLKAKSSKDEAESYCDGPACGDPRGVDAGNEAHDAASISTIGMVAGVVCLAGGAALWFTAPDEAVKVGLGPRGVAVGGSF